MANELAIFQERGQRGTRRSWSDAAFVYALQIGGNGLVRLGFSHDVPLRLRQLQTSYTEPLRILWYQLGTREDEALLHTEFAAYRRTGEWFDLQGPYVVDELNRLVPPGYAEGIVGEWIARSIASDTELMRLMDTLHVGTFGLTIQQHAHLKDLEPRDSLGDSETDMELAIADVGDRAARKLHRLRNSQGFSALRQDCKEAGDVAGDARRKIEDLTGEKVVSPENYKQLQQWRQRELQPGLFDEPNEPDE